ncbi:hypothetical protein SNOG_06156 [Parastagonospora nodorum SN15]|uniref:Uncharacterized protein n=1 Tax=Phaeosphaeria nodorum (strain SN15 / ATCC MYA-4574 / FGSC 10173) TaxID=321614 RepID=Q0UQ08_PHANO|nr:hypothetical protein SNOG_06156 [Parastagonospora nodorum SN15]EAT85987.2 hypothetical protein SNOG_06156 [Parastagonospora nodorum SN15]
MLAASLGDTALALYPIRHSSTTQELVEPLAETVPIPPGAKGRIWSCEFLSKDRVAVGLGPSNEPIHIYDVTPNGFLSQPLRTFNLESKSWVESQPDNNASRNTSVYPILPVHGTAQCGSDAGNVFLSGGYDGITRLHDVRSPRSFETMFWDPTNDSSVYSLAMQGLERIVVGVSMHSMIKVFDLRLAGSHAYQSFSLSSKPKPKPKTQAPNHDYYNAIVRNAKDPSSTVSGGWNLYLNPRIRPRRDAYREDYSRGGQDSPVYTSGTVDIQSSYDPRGDALNLGMYEQGTEEGLGTRVIAGQEGNYRRKSKLKVKIKDAVVDVGIIAAAEEVVEGEVVALVVHEVEAHSPTQDIRLNCLCYPAPSVIEEEPKMLVAFD